MRYCRHRKIAFFFTARTGGTSLSRLLWSWGVPSIHVDELIEAENIRHMLPKDAEMRMPELKEYTRYCFLRNPTTRFLSACKFYRRSFDFDLTVERIISNFDFYSQHPTFFKQVNYFDNVQFLDFDNYENEVKKIGLLFGKEDFKIPKSNVSSPRPLQINNESLDFIKSYYAEDYKLIKDVFGKEF